MVLPNVGIVDVAATRFLSFRFIPGKVRIERAFCDDESIRPDWNNLDKLLYELYQIIKH
jgi:hypothetical protein